MSESLDDGTGKVGNTFPTVAVDPYQYWARVDRVVDGDTVDLHVAVGFDIEMSGRFRLRGIDTPEIFGVLHASDEYRAGVAAMERLISLIPESGWVEIRTHRGDGREKYGRYLCDLYAAGVNVVDVLISEGLAIARPT